MDRPVRRRRRARDARVRGGDVRLGHVLSKAGRERRDAEGEVAEVRGDAARPWEGGSCGGEKGGSCGGGGE